MKMPHTRERTHALAGNRILLAAVGFGVPFLIVATAIVSMGDGPGRVMPGFTQSLDSDPFVNGEETTLEAAEAMLGRHVVRPDSDIASDSNISRVWVDKVNKRVAIYYGSGVLLTIQSADETDSNPAKRRANQEEFVAAQDGASTILQVNGVTAVGTQQDFGGNEACGTPGADCIPPQNNPSAITMVLGNDSIEILAEIPLDELTRTADTIA
jgi:hypothetical protein